MTGSLDNSDDTHALKTNGIAVPAVRHLKPSEHVGFDSLPEQYVQLSLLSPFNY